MDEKRIKLLDKHFWRSKIGQEVKRDALSDILVREKDIRASIEAAKDQRDRALDSLAAEALTREADHLQAKLDFKAAEEKLQAANWHVAVGLPSRMDEARRLHDIAVVPLRDELAELGNARAELHAAG